METAKIALPSLFFIKDNLVGNNIDSSRRVLADLSSIFEDKVAFSTLAPDTPVYDVYCHLPEKEGTPGGLYFGLTKIYPGKVGKEYFMTKGHFHAQIDRAEYYWGLEGEGMLIFMDEKRNIRAERMFPGSLHYIPGGIAHRVANTGSSILSFAACWPSDAGHNYEEIAEHGFSARLMETNGVPQLISNHV